MDGTYGSGVEIYFRKTQQAVSLEGGPMEGAAGRCDSSRFPEFRTSYKGDQTTRQLEEE